MDIPIRNHGIFVQDSWKIHPNLTLNIGLRYNYYAVEFLDMNNSTAKSFNPRFGFSWDPLGDGKTAIRGGIGTFTNNIFSVPATRIARGREASVRYVLFPGYPDPAVPNPFVPPADITSPPTEYIAQEDQIPPYTLQVTLGGQRQVMENLSLSADLIYARGYHLCREENRNAPIPGTSVLRPDPTKANVLVWADTGKSDYKAVQFVLNKRYAHGWSVEVQYTLSKSMTDCTDWFATNWNNPELDWGPHMFDSRHRLNFIGIFDIPFGFQLSAIFQYYSAPPYNVTLGYDANLDGQLYDYPAGKSRNSGRAGDFISLDARISKFLNVGRFRFQIFAEMFNLTNRVNYPSWAYVGNMLSPSFGEPFAASDPRLIQLGARIDF
jgi:hypothetical protein